MLAAGGGVTDQTYTTRLFARSVQFTGDLMEQPTIGAAGWGADIRVPGLGGTDWWPQHPPEAAVLALLRICVPGILEPFVRALAHHGEHLRSRRELARLAGCSVSALQGRLHTSSLPSAYRLACHVQWVHAYWHRAPTTFAKVRAGTSVHARSAFGAAWYKRDVGLSAEEQIALGAPVSGIDALARVLRRADATGEVPAVARVVSAALEDAARARQCQPGLASRSQEHSSLSVR
jgi:hypothetical protein